MSLSPVLDAGLGPVREDTAAVSERVTSPLLQTQEKRLRLADIQRERPRKLLGEGTYGAVEYAVIQSTQTPIALKFMPFGDTAHRGSIIRELQSYWAVAHPNIVGFYGACYSDEDHAICFGLELMTAGSLADCLCAFHKLF